MSTLLAIYGSPRKNGNTSILLQNAVAGARDAGAYVEEIRLHRLKISPCLEIYGCKKDGRCVIKDDFQAVYDQLSTCDGIMIASPVFFYSVSAYIKILMDRCQAFWVKKYLIDKRPFGLPEKRRKGLVLSIGASHKENLFDGIILSMKAFFDALDVELATKLLYRGIDMEGEILEHADYLAEAYEAGKNFSSDIRDSLA